MLHCPNGHFSLSKLRPAGSQLRNHPRQTINVPTLTMARLSALPGLPRLSTRNEWCFQCPNNISIHSKWIHIFWYLLIIFMEFKKPITPSSMGNNTSKLYNSVVTKYEVLRSSKLRQFTPSDTQPRSLAAFFGRRTFLIPRVWTACSCSSAGSSNCFVSDSREDFTSNKAPLILKSSLREKMLLLKYPKTSQQGECGGKKTLHSLKYEISTIPRNLFQARKVVNPAFVPRNSSNSSFLSFFGDQCRSTWSKWPPNYVVILKTDSHTLILYQHLTIKSIHILEI